MHLDGAGPLGDPYQIDSANHGPYGAAVTRELLPYVEAAFSRHRPGPRPLPGRRLDRRLGGAGTSGLLPGLLQRRLVVLPRQRRFPLVSACRHLSKTKTPISTSMASSGPARATSRGDVRYTMRHECQVENVLGRGDSWTLSGGQWGAWNATYGARGPDGLPVPLWDPKTGVIDHKAAEHWQRYDLRRVLEANWAVLGPQAQGQAAHLGGRGRRLFSEQRRPSPR